MNRTKSLLFAILPAVLLVFCLCPPALARDGGEALTLQQMEEILAQREASDEEAFARKQAWDIAFLEDSLALTKSEVENLTAQKGLSDEKHNLLQQKLEESLAELQADASVSDADKIARIIETVFFLRCLDFRDALAYDFAPFMADTEEPSLQYFIGKSLFEKKWAQRSRERSAASLGLTMEVEITNIAQKENGADVTANVTERERYANGNLGVSVYRYQIAMSRQAGEWRIASMRSDDSQEAHYLQRGEPFDVEAELAARLNPRPLDPETVALNQATEKRRQEYLQMQKEREARAGNRTYNRTEAGAFARPHAFLYCPYCTPMPQEYQNFTMQGVRQRTEPCRSLCSLMRPPFGQEG